ncbi:MAG: hypothetical protein IID42_04820 [Planctomycetes bacterium]|nr:hypothetical protein [Planctomycetota bacterium]
MKIEPVILVDSREKRPFIFENLPTEVGTLDTGDYSVAGLTHLIAVERKSLPDLLACCGRDRSRFKRELQRLKAYPFRLLVIETTAAELEAGDWRSKLKPSHVIGSLAAWQVQYSLPVWFGGDHAACGRFAERFLHQSVRTIANDYSAASRILRQG